VKSPKYDWRVAKFAIFVTAPKRVGWCHHKQIFFDILYQIFFNLLSKEYSSTMVLQLLHKLFGHFVPTNIKLTIIYGVEIINYYRHILALDFFQVLLLSHLFVTIVSVGRVSFNFYWADMRYTVETVV